MSEELKPCPLSPERAIEILWDEIARNQQPLRCTRKELCDAVEIAEEAIRRAQQPNEPLTLEQLRQMSGEPVWCQSLPAGTYGSRWSICYGEDLEKYPTPQIAMSLGEYEESDYGKTWLAYRSKPEAGEKE